MVDSNPSTSAQLLLKRVNQLECALGLERQLVAVTFHATRKSFEEAPEKAVTGAMSYCSMVRLATFGYARKASSAQVRCPGAKRALGLTPSDEEFRSGRRFLSLGLYRDTANAQKTAAQISIIADGIYGFSIKPLSSCDSLPNVILCICNPNQAMRLIQGFIYNHGPAGTLASMGMQGVCAELTATPYCNQGVNVSLLCSNTRYSCSWSDNELGVGIFAGIFDALVDGVLQSINPSESDKSKRHILSHGQSKGLHMNIRFGCDYYSSPRQLVHKKQNNTNLTAVSLSDLRKSYSRKNGAAVLVLDGIDLDIHSHEFLSV